jgi:hypothetical protein
LARKPLIAEKITPTIRSNNKRYRRCGRG